MKIHLDFETAKQIIFTSLAEKPSCHFGPSG
jgi:hypothetical protein